MFEKEAKKHKENFITTYINAGGGMKAADIIGAQKEQSYQEGAELGYNKANEWHYVKDGDLPKHEVNVLVLYNVQCIDIAHYNYDYKEWHFRDSIVRDVIAWCELPKFEE